MKKYLLGFILVAPWLAQAQAPVSFTLKGKMDKLDAPAKVYLRREGLQRGSITDSAVVQNGTFELKGTLETPTRAQLVLVQKKNRMRLLTGQADNASFYLEKGTITFTSPDSLTNAKITGTKLNEEYAKLQAALKPGQQRMQARYTEILTASPEQRKDSAFIKRGEEIRKELNRQYTAFIKANPNSLVSLDAVEEAGGAVPNYAEVALLFAALSPSVKATPQGKKYAQALDILKTVSVGAQAPNFTQQTPEGKQVALTDYRGKYVLVDFWASWCVPCRQENPAVTKVYNEYKDKNFDILGVSLDTEKTRDKWVKAIADDQLAWTQVSDLKGGENTVAVQYHVQAIPQNFLVDPSGKIVAVNLRGEDLHTTLAKYIK